MFFVLAVGIFGAIIASTGYLFAQEPPQFTVISVKPSPDNLPGMVVRQLGNGGYSGQKIPLVALLTSAYGLSPQRIVGLPSWANTDRYDIEARYEPRDQPIPPMNLLLQGLLRERFGLVAHTEMRNFPVYLLKTVDKEGKLEKGLKAANAQCADTTAANGARLSNERVQNGAPLCAAIERPGAFISGGVTMDTLARSLRIPSGRDVINETGLHGAWEFTLEFAGPGDTSGEKPDIFTAIKEALDLKLESGTGPLDVLVIDSVSHPTSN
jgi:uncharacterized protein (TIGR03435 family)